MSYRLLVVDIDGTLIGQDGLVSKRNCVALQRAKASGLSVALCTGRPPQACHSLLIELDLPGPHIFFDGALVSSTDISSPILLRSLNRKTALDLAEFTESRGISVELYTEEGFYAQQPSKGSSIQSERLGFSPTLLDLRELIAQKPIVKGAIVLFGPDKEAIEAALMAHFAGALHFGIAKSPHYPDADFLNITDASASKGTALRTLASYLAVPLEQIAAIGDAPNDVSLIVEAGLGIAMGNAPHEVKAAAQLVTSDVTEDGLAEAIERFLLRTS